MSSINKGLIRILILFLICNFSVLAQSPVPYSKIDSIFQSTWEKTYPIMYSKILKKDLIGKGIIAIREKKGFVYLYTFLVAFPKLNVENGNLQIEQENFKQIEVKLYFDPSQKENPYWMDLGEITEIYDKSKIARYIK